MRRDDNKGKVRPLFDQLGRTMCLDESKVTSVSTFAEAVKEQQERHRLAVGVIPARSEEQVGDGDGFGRFVGLRHDGQ